MIKLLKKKSEALARADKLLANLKSMQASRTNGPFKIVGNVK